MTVFFVSPCIKIRVWNLQPACTFDMVHIRIFVTQVRVQQCFKTKLHDMQVLE